MWNPVHRIVAWTVLTFVAAGAARAEEPPRAGAADPHDAHAQVDQNIDARLAALRAEYEARRAALLAQEPSCDEQALASALAAAQGQVRQAQSACDAAAAAAARARAERDRRRVAVMDAYRALRPFVRDQAIGRGWTRYASPAPGVPSFWIGPGVQRILAGKAPDVGHVRQAFRTFYAAVAAFVQASARSDAADRAAQAASAALASAQQACAAAQAAYDACVAEHRAWAEALADLDGRYQAAVADLEALRAQMHGAVDDRAREISDLRAELDRILTQCGWVLDRIRTLQDQIKDTNIGSANLYDFVVLLRQAQEELEALYRRAVELLNQIHEREVASGIGSTGDSDEAIRAWLDCIVCTWTDGLPDIALQALTWSVRPPEGLSGGDVETTQSMILFQTIQLWRHMCDAYGYDGSIDDFLESFTSWSGYAALPQEEKDAYRDAKAQIDGLQIAYHYRPADASGGIVDHGEILIGRIAYSFMDGRPEGGRGGGRMAKTPAGPGADSHVVYLEYLSTVDKFEILRRAETFYWVYTNWYSLTPEQQEAFGDLFEYNIVDWNCFQFAMMLLRAAPSVRDETGSALCTCTLGATVASDVADWLVSHWLGHLISMTEWNGLVGW